MTDLVKSKQRVTDHGEVFTPEWLVNAMLDLVKNETERIDSRFLESACGSGNFLVKILERKLYAVGEKYRNTEFEHLHFSISALMSLYGIELLEDNAAECRANLLKVFCRYLSVSETTESAIAAKNILKANIVLGDALSMKSPDGKPLEFPEWAYLSKGKFSRRDFVFDDLTQRSAFEGTLFDGLEIHEIFEPVRAYPPLTISDIAKQVG